MEEQTSGPIAWPVGQIETAWLVRDHRANSHKTNTGVQDGHEKRLLDWSRKKAEKTVGVCWAGKQCVREIC
jgi:hypothetical protein